MWRLYRENEGSSTSMKPRDQQQGRERKEKHTGQQHQTVDISGPSLSSRFLSLCLFLSAIHFPISVSPIFKLIRGSLPLFSHLSPSFVRAKSAPFHRDRAYVVYFIALPALLQPSCLLLVSFLTLAIQALYVPCALFHPPTATTILSFLIPAAPSPPPFPPSPCLPLPHTRRSLILLSRRRTPFHED